jgi:AcrR family transcriptional regulator
MLSCFEEGSIRPAAREVAARARVSTRAVFRHFDSMESLLEQVAELQHERVLSQLPPLSFDGTREERVASLVARTTRAFELTAAVRRAAVLAEPFSETIRSRHAWLRAEIRGAIRRALAEELEALCETDRRIRIAGIRALISNSYWNELRTHERLSVAAASRALSEAIHALL